MYWDFHRRNSATTNYTAVTIAGGITSEAEVEQGKTCVAGMRTNSGADVKDS